MKQLREDRAVRDIPARPESIRAVLLNPVGMPGWNPALLSVAGSGPAVVGHRYPIVLRPGIRGHMIYRAVTEERIDIDFDIVIGRERGWWELTEQPDKASTLVCHAFVHPGLLGRIMAGAFSGVAELRVGRLDDQFRGV
jgi:hypothetical protein